MGEQVQRGAEPADHADDLGAWGLHPVCNSNRVVLPDDLPEVPGGGQLVVESAVDDENHALLTRLGPFAEELLSP